MELQDLPLNAALHGSLFGGIDLAAGRGIIGHRLLRSDMIWVPRVDDFIDPRHRTIWNIIQNIHKATNAVDIDSVSLILCFCADAEELLELNGIARSIGIESK